jgi:hypothetical protein
MYYNGVVYCMYGTKTLGVERYEQDGRHCGTGELL